MESAKCTTLSLADIARATAVSSNKIFERDVNMREEFYWNKENFIR